MACSTPVGAFDCVRRGPDLGEGNLCTRKKKLLRYLQKEFIGNLPKEGTIRFSGGKNHFSGISLSNFRDHWYIFITIIIFTLTKKYLINTNINTLKSHIKYITTFIIQFYLFKNLLLYIKDPFNIFSNCKFFFKAIAFIIVKDVATSNSI